jgi:nitroreductase
MTFDDIVRLRRSVRKYVDRPIPAEAWDALADAAASACEAFALSSVRFVFVRGTETRKKFMSAVFSGVQGKVNPWLLVTKAPGFIAVAGEVGKGDDAELYLAHAAMAMEAVVLAAAEIGLGTCWIGGFGERKLTDLLGLPDGVRIVAVSPLGYPGDGGPRTEASARRKPLAVIARGANGEGAR